jgi:hypothetical protein
MNVMFDELKNKWVLIDFGMVYSDTYMKKTAKKNNISLKDQYLVNAFDIILKVEMLFMKKLYKSANFQYTPIGGGFVPKKSFPSLIHELNKKGLLKYSQQFELYRHMRELKGKFYDNSKMIGI